MSGFVSCHGQVHLNWGSTSVTPPSESFKPHVPCLEIELNNSSYSAQLVRGGKTPNFLFLSLSLPRGCMVHEQLALLRAKGAARPHGCCNVSCYRNPVLKVDQERFGLRAPPSLAPPYSDYYILQASANFQTPCQEDCLPRPPSLTMPRLGRAPLCPLADLHPMLSLPL